MAKNDNLQDFLTDVADAIREKKGTTALINPQDFAAEISSIETGGSAGVAEDDLTFYDYDGTILYSYSAEEVEAMTELPPLPEHEGLINQGWIFTLDLIKEQLATYGRWGVGCVYDTDDGKTRLYVNLNDSDTLAHTLTIGSNWEFTIEIDWGDGAIESFTKTNGEHNFSHEYSSIGEYVIKIKRIEGTSWLNSTGTFSLYLEKAEIGSKGIVSYQNTFQGCSNLKSVTYFKNQSGLNSGSVFVGCTSLKYFCFWGKTYAPSFSGSTALEVIIIHTYDSSAGLVSCANCVNLRSVYIHDDRNGEILTPQTCSFAHCSSLRHLCYNKLEKYGYFYQNSFEHCHNLTKIRSSIIFISNSSYNPEKTFSCCVALEDISFKESNTIIPPYAFQYCVSLKNITLSNALTTIGKYAFYRSGIKDAIDLSNAITKEIGEYAFANTSIKSVKLPKTIANINGYCFSNCCKLSMLDCSLLEAIPSLGNGVFNNTSQELKICVPYYLCDKWKVATNWSTYADNIVADYTPEECVSLQIEADDVIGNATSTTVRWTAITNGTNWKGEYVEGIAISLTASSEKFPKNESATDSVTREISFTFLGVTATTTITQGPYIDNAIICKYNVTRTSSATQLLYSSFSNYSTYFGSMLIDGEEVAIAQKYTFPTTGEHEVVFKVKDGVDVVTPYRMFYNISTLTEVDCSALDLSKATSTSSSAGTAHMFYGCTNLKKIILPESTACMGSNMFYNCKAVTEFTILNPVAPTLYSSNTFGSNSYFIGYTNRSAGTNKFYVPAGATGYDTGNWTSHLYNKSYCGFTKEEIAE